MSVSAHNGAATQALGEQAKDAVKTWVPKLRRLVEDDFRAQLDRLGLRPGGRHTPVESMHLPEEAQDVRRAAEALLRRETAAENSPRGGFDAVVGELAYTLINRLVGLKAMEARGLLFLPPPADPNAPPEPTEVLTPVEGQAYSRYLRDFRGAHGSRYKYETNAEEALLRDGLTAAFAYITRDIGVLFDPDHEYSCVWPTHATLARVIAMINGDLPAEAYRAPDFLGWVYQFFRQHESDELRQENQGTPQSSHELAVMNQFYTPGWVVKALVDNTLGRLWIQMHPDSRLGPVRPGEAPAGGAASAPLADYLVPHTGERLRYQRLSAQGEVQAFKPAREIALLDPACGTMHFGQYAFGLFEQMYLDEIENAGRPGWPKEPSVPQRGDIPATIIENNLFGIDIDARAIQIASLSLMLTAKEAAARHGATSTEVRIRRTNLVVANAVDLGREGVRRLVGSLKSGNGSDDLRERLFTTIWENLQNVGELGSLTQVREGVAEALNDWTEARARSKGLTTLTRREEQQPRFAFAGEMDREQARQLQLEHNLLDDEARQMEAELLAALEAAAGAATDDPSDRLFAEDTARGLKLIQLLSRSYDVVVMNPPYGAFVPKVKEFVRATYPLTYNDIYAAFIDRATMLVEREGYVGALVSRTFMTNKTHERLRTEILLKRNPLVVLLDLGEGILEATVQTAALVLRGSPR
ncbi:MAG: Eco57I restriction-modification methylase domain-containing protein [Thermoleophilia bacterium]